MATSCVRRLCARACGGSSACASAAFMMRHPCAGASMDRRAFVRLVGGGVVMAAGAAAGGCSGGIPPEAVAAWQGPGNEPDLRRWILAHALLAPHSHNLQSWLVDLRTD